MGKNDSQMNCISSLSLCFFYNFFSLILMHNRMNCCPNELVAAVVALWMTVGDALPTQTHAEYTVIILATCCYQFGPHSHTQTRRFESSRGEKSLFFLSSYKA